MTTWGWHGDALRALQELALKQRLITCDDLHGVEGLAEPRHHNQWGPVFNDAVKLGMIRQTRTFVKSTRAPSKRRNLQLWESRYFDHEGPLTRSADQIYEEQRTNQPSLMNSSAAV
jgi:hypothetical protein